MFRVMSFNIRGAFHDDGENEWDKRRALNIATIKKYNPDIIGFQEVQEGNIVDYKAALTEYEYELGFISIRKTEQYHQIPIFWNPSRFEKLDTGGFYLSETPHKWSLGWDSTLIRAVTWVKLRDFQNDIEFIVLNTHYPHERDTDTTRANCSTLIIEQLAKIAPNLPQIVTADFNAHPTSHAYKLFIDHDYVDSYIVAGETQDYNTFHGFQGDAYEWQVGRIDWILTKDSNKQLISKSAQVIFDAKPPIYPSDHYPILAELDFM
ncbi:MAG: endonuclease/exonuclease/phosphatase family protein [Phototrophicaceae bacterium]